MHQLYVLLQVIVAITSPWYVCAAMMLFWVARWHQWKWWMVRRRGKDPKVCTRRGLRLWRHMSSAYLSVLGRVC